MLAAKNMNVNKQTIFWEKVNLKNEADVKGLLSWCKRRPTRKTMSQNLKYSLGDFMELEFKS